MKSFDVFKIGLIYFISALCFLLVKLFYNLGFLIFLGGNANLIVNIAIQVLFMLLLPAVLFLAFFKGGPKRLFRTCQFRKINFKTVLLSFVCGFVIFLLVVIISTLASSLLASFGYKNPFVSESVEGGNVWTLFVIPVLTSAILPGFCEEFLNRGILFGGTRRFNAKNSIMISALLFALLHMNINQVVYAFFVGLVIGFIAYFSRSIWPGIIIHFTNNFCSCYFSFASTKQIFGKNFYNIFVKIFSGNLLVVVLQIVLVALLLCFILQLILKEMFKQTITNRIAEKLSDTTKKYYPTLDEFDKNSTVDIDLEGKDGQIIMQMHDEVFKSFAFELDEEKSFFEKAINQSTKCDVDVKKKDKIFVYASIFMTAIVTIFTLIWGLL